MVFDAYLGNEALMYVKIISNKRSFDARKINGFLMRTKNGPSIRSKNGPSMRVNKSCV